MTERKHVYIDETAMFDKQEYLLIRTALSSLESECLAKAKQHESLAGCAVCLTKDELGLWSASISSAGEFFGASHCATAEEALEALKLLLA